MKKRIVLNALLVLVHILLIPFLFFVGCWPVALLALLPILVAIPAFSLFLEIIFCKKFKQHLLISRDKCGNIKVHLSSDVTLDKYKAVLQDLDEFIEQETSAKNSGTKKIQVRAWLIEGAICTHLESKGFKKSTSTSKRLNEANSIMYLLFLWYTMLWRLPLIGVAKYQVDHGMVCMFKKYFHIISVTWVKEI